MDLTAAINLIKRFEGCGLKAYQDIRGIWTVGYGCTGPNISVGMEITQAQADELLSSRVNFTADEILKSLTAPASGNQLCSFTSLAYNIGLGNFHTSTLLRLFNEGASSASIAEQFMRWDHVAGKVVQGLANRRQAEMQLFLTQASAA